ncbi:hypothetical protein [Gordonia sp. ABSL49_1]|uniref:hypothetical protein n=1 Tax=Gordonia sp. ABSL49_1 TaxID=2920941 RepID=UPI001F116F8C|nr:hypothetical protein [Gordonia sp. ABSL49_1]MCH5644089.1 hypothetical protein [Gordonia sp. ABSL49_1]
MKASSVSSANLHGVGRLDAGYYLSGADAIRDRISTATGVTRHLVGSLGDVYAPSRFKRTYAVPGEDAVSYLRPYDVFEYLPPEADRLSVSRTVNLENYLIAEGDILQTCSGRNLGPVTIADAYLAQFALSHDMVRIRIHDEVERHYTLAFLRSQTGQHLLRGDLGGSVISHITTDHISALTVPFVDGLVNTVASDVRKAVKLRETARQTLHQAVSDLNHKFPNPVADQRSGWTVTAASLAVRLDAAFHSDKAAAARELLTSNGGVALSDVATVAKPGGRPKLVYVDADHGAPFLSGRQILQCDVVAAKYLSTHGNSTIDERFELETGSVIFQADGRAEESLGYPSLVAADRHGWLASGHVGRARPEKKADAGWIWAAMASDAVRTQVAALSCGSVVDALYPDDLRSVILPPRESIDAKAVTEAWNDMSKSTQLFTKASAAIDDALG